jgi:spore coat polysaccharide biosynthesis protein SpsF
MNIGIVVFSRYSSSRLPGKALKEFQDKPLLQYVYERMTTVLDKGNVVIATSEESSDDIIEKYCLEHNINCFRGDLNNVAKRLIDCAAFYNFDYVIRITGDSIFIDQNIILSMISSIEEGYDYITNRVPKTYPVGMSVDILKMEFYNNIYHSFKTNSHREHVVTYLLENIQSVNYKNIPNTICLESKDINLAIDTQEDFEMSQKIVDSFVLNHTSYGLREIYKLYTNE